MINRSLAQQLPAFSDHAVGADSATVNRAARCGHQTGQRAVLHLVSAAQPARNTTPSPSHRPTPGDAATRGHLDSVAQGAVAPARVLATSLEDRVAVNLMLLVIWGFAGALFGALFSGLYRFMAILGAPGWLVLVMSTAIAAMTTAAFYSAMPVALIGAIAGTLASVGCLILAGQAVALMTLVGVATGAGMFAGLIYAWVVTSGSRPVTRTLGGLLAGLLAGSTLVVLFAAAGLQTNMMVLVAVTVAVVGTYFELSEHLFSRLVPTWIPARFSAVAIAGLIAGVVGASFWFVGQATAAWLDQQSVSALAQVLDDVPGGLIGGFAGGCLAGSALLALQTLGLRLEAALA